MSFVCGKSTPASHVSVHCGHRTPLFVEKIGSMGSLEPSADDGTDPLGGV